MKREKRVDGLTRYKVFGLLMAEMALFMLLLIPLPFNIKRRIFTYDAQQMPDILQKHALTRLS